MKKEGEMINTSIIEGNVEGSFVMNSRGLIDIIYRKRTTGEKAGG